MSLALNRNNIYTYKDYLEWSDEVNYELIDGIIYDMTPAPLRKHQGILRDLLVQITQFLKDKPCEVYGAPFDVRLPKGKEKENFINTVVQPDIVIICDKKKLDEKGCKGAPDFVIEITSPKTVSKDMIEKFALYERHGIKEYWIVQPDEKIVMAFTLNKKKEYGKPYICSADDIIESEKIRGLSVDLRSIDWE